VAGHLLDPTGGGRGLHQAAVGPRDRPLRPTPAGGSSTTGRHCWPQTPPGSPTSCARGRPP